MQVNSGLCNRVHKISVGSSYFDTATTNYMDATGSSKGPHLKTVLDLYVFDYVGARLALFSFTDNIVQVRYCYSTNNQAGRTKLHFTLAHSSFSRDRLDAWPLSPLSGHKIQLRACCLSRRLMIDLLQRFGLSVRQ